jgi:hypothetical protein
MALSSMGALAGATAASGVSNIIDCISDSGAGSGARMTVTPAGWITRWPGGRHPGSGWLKISDVISSSMASILAAVARAISRWRARSASPSAMVRRDGSPVRTTVLMGLSGASFFLDKKEKRPTAYPVGLSWHDVSTAASAARCAHVRWVKGVSSRYGKR